MTKFSLTLGVAAIALLPVTLTAQQAPTPAETGAPASNIGTMPPPSPRPGAGEDGEDEGAPRDRVDQPQPVPSANTAPGPALTPAPVTGRNTALIQPVGGAADSMRNALGGAMPAASGPRNPAPNGVTQPTVPAIGSIQSAATAAPPARPADQGVGGSPSLAAPVRGAANAVRSGMNAAISPPTGAARPQGGAGDQGGQGQGGGGGSGTSAGAQYWPTPSPAPTSTGQYWPTPQPQTAPPPPLDPTPVIEMGGNFGDIPEGFLQAVELIDRMGPNISEAEFTRATGIRFADFQNLARSAETLAADTTGLKRRADLLKAEVSVVMSTINSLRRTLGSGATTETLVNGFGPIGLATLRAQEARAQQLLAQIGNLDTAIQRNLRASHKIAVQLENLDDLKTALQSRGLLRFAKGLGDAIEKLRLAPIFTVLGGIADIATVYGASTALGDFDPGRGGDLELSYEYDSALGNIKDVTLNLVGLAANTAAAVATGNVMPAVTEFLTVSTGRLTDIYMAYTAWQAADAEAELAQRQYLLTLMRRNRLINERQAAAIQADVSRLDRNIRDLNTELANRRPNPARDPNWRDPRFDPDTGLPIADYWRWLRANSPATLVQMGIDPEAPVGGWPNGVRPQDRPRTPVTAQPRIPTGPGYPTAPLRRPRPGATAEADDIEPTLPPSTRPEPTPVTFIPKPKPKPAKVNLTLDIVPVTFTPPTFTPPTFVGPTFTPPKWTPPEFKPPKWTPPKFDAPKPSKIKWTQFDKKSQYPGGADNLAWEFDELSGTVATDLSKWEEWLATQNVTYLTQLALAAGYPNLAAALADARNLMRNAGNSGFRQWAFAPPVGTGAIGIWASEAQHNLARAQVLLGDLLGQSRDIFSTGGLTDIGISGTDLAYILRDFGLEDGDQVDIAVEQFGRTIFTTRLSLLNRGTDFSHLLKKGVARLVITAVNEGAISPNTAEINLKNVVRGNSTQTYSLLTGDQAILRIETNAPTQQGTGQ